MNAPNPDRLAELARQLAAQDGVDAVLRRIVDATLSQVDGAEHAGITVVKGRSVSTPVATDEFVNAVDQRQYDVGEGPCLMAALEAEPVVCVDDLSRDPRWPKFSAAVGDLAVRSMLSLCLYTDTNTFGALNIYAAGPYAFGAESVHTGRLLAAHAAVAAAAHIENANLRLALHNRDVIGQAKGILMERFKITDSQAFALLIHASQQTHRKLAAVAEELTATGQLADG